MRMATSPRDGSSGPFGVGRILPFKEATFDVVFSIGVLHHTPFAERASRGVFCYCRPGGTLAVCLVRATQRLPLVGVAEP